MYLKRLEIQGYKSFANRTEICLDGGITAIVGPNGSGKSNVADAIRWALGEQTYSALRAKRTEDLIFSGSPQRARLGLAEVSLILDNGAQWLPLDYSEVIITRRAYRSGENEYLLNGNRMRLRDITDTLTRAGLGRSASVVIGQGQVDAALSLRPEERRTLFEETAGVRIYIDKRDEALARLEETRRNLERLNDVINEVTPRLEALSRQAERTREHDAAKSDLDTALVQWYGYQWHRQQDRLAKVTEKQSEQSNLVCQEKERLQRIVAERERLRTLQEALITSILGKRQQADQLRSSHEELRRKAAVTQERARALQRQQDQVQSDWASAEVRRAELQAVVNHQARELATLKDTILEQQAAAVAAQALAAAAEADLRTQREDLERARATAFHLATSLATTRNRLGQLRKRQADLEHELSEQRRAQTEAEARATAAQHDSQEAEREHEAALEALTQAETELRQAEDVVASSTTRLDQLRNVRNAARESQHRLHTQYEILQRARNQGAHLHEGTQAVVREGMPGVIGTVASLIDVPTELEAAIETALGGHLQDVVISTWNDALACIELLKRRERGRATFLPLDYVRPPRPIPPPRLPGVRGVASQLIKVRHEHVGVCDLLLGNIIIVDELTVGRKALAADSRLRRAVTLDGDTVETRGVVRGGSRPQGRGFLAQEREWRELPERLATAQQALTEAEAGVREEEGRQQALRQLARDCAQRLQERRSGLGQVEQRRGALRQRLDRLQQEVSWHRSLAERSAATLQGLRTDLTLAGSEAAMLEQSMTEATQRVEALRHGAEGEALQQVRRQASACETTLAVSERTRQTQEQFVATQREALARAISEAQARQATLERLQMEGAALAQEVEGIHVALTKSEQAREALAQPLATAEAELQAVEREKAALEGEEGRAGQQLQGLQTEQGRLSFERERVLEAVEEARRHMEAELGPIEVPDAGQPCQLRLSLGGQVTPLPQVGDLPEGMAQSVKELRTRLRRLTPVNPDAPAEHAELLIRHQFLMEQVQDLTRAAESTSDVILHLNRLIRESFGQAFVRIAREFSECFTKLFDGGSAKLLLSDPDNPADCGIEIIARPPGKRAQGLALLSGGERALTAAALLFAMLKVNPLPFCVLDEVDAMLDESNVHRFSALLEELARQTQFVVITHNRSTVEAASALYGVSMAQEGVSQILSLRLPDRAAAESPIAISAA